jgi:ATP-dependent helicase HrpA
MKQTSKIHYPEDLPIISLRQKIIEAVTENKVVIISGDTGSGKTTQLPKMCLEAGRGRKKMIGCTQPRRIAAITVAARVAEELGKNGAHLVGHKIRFQDKTTRDTRIKFMTDGILLAETQSSRKLAAYDTLIIDEAHERSLNIDFLLGYLKQLVAQRKDLKLIITSATIDTEKFAAHFNNAPIIEVSGRTYPVEVRYRPTESDEEGKQTNTYIDQAVKEVLHLRKLKMTGDILIFMPTERDIRETAEILEQELNPAVSHKKTSQHKGQTLILPLFGRLRAADQKRVFRSHKTQKIVIATNVAETSITVPGIRYVIDTGLARISTYNVRARTTSLPVTPVSRASCDQRQGRCGRIGPGICIRLFSQEDYLNRAEFTLPEIKRSNLAEVILRMIDLKLGDPATFPFIDPPGNRAIKDGYDLLNELGALDHTPDKIRLSNRGRLMARLPLDPRIARMIIEAREHNCLQEVVVIAAALAIQDPRSRPAAKESEADTAHARFKAHPSDFLSFLKIWENFNNLSFDKKENSRKKSRSQIRKFCRSHFLSYQRLREWQDIYEQITSILREEKGYSLNRRAASYTDIHYAILSGFLRNIAYRKAKNIYQGAQGKELMVFPGSILFNKGGQWIMAAELVETARLFARVTADIKAEWLEPLAGPMCRSTYSNPRWEKKSGKVIANEKVTLFGLVIVASRRKNYARINEKTRNEARQIFIESALIQGELSGSYRFLEHNLQLVESFEKIEDRMRQRGVLADDYTLYKFYDARLDRSVHDRASLNRFLKQRDNEKNLFMSESDIVLQAPESGMLSDFPDELPVNGFTVKVSYSFDPGSDEDGITVTIPLDLLDHVSPEFFEWLVPGLLAEKVFFLLKGLPKNIRKQLIPIQKTAEDITSDLKIYEGSLYRALEKLIYKQIRLKVARSQWPIEKLPDHLKVRYLLINSNGRKIMTSRSFSELGAPKTPKKKTVPFDQIRKKWERGNITTWDFSGLPEKIPLHGGKNILQGYAYPALQVDNKGDIAIRLYTDLTKSRKINLDGLLALYSLHLPRQFKLLKKECRLPAASWALYEGFGKRQQLNDELYRFILLEVFHCRDGSLPDQKSFANLVTNVKQSGLFSLGKKYINLVLDVLQERRATLDHISKLEKMSGKISSPVLDFNDFRQQLQAILPRDFLLYFTAEHIKAASRYCKGLVIRLDRAYVSPAKDKAKNSQLAVHLDKLENLPLNEPSSQCRRLLEEYRLMLEEFKISLFAPEIKTQFPISAKRLEKKWQAILDSC